MTDLELPAESVPQLTPKGLFDWCGYPPTIDIFQDGRWTQEFMKISLIWAPIVTSLFIVAGVLMHRVLRYRPERVMTRLAFILTNDKAFFYLRHVLAGLIYLMLAAPFVTLGIYGWVIYSIDSSGQFLPIAVSFVLAPTTLLTSTFAVLHWRANRWLPDMITVACLVFAFWCFLVMWMFLAWSPPFSIFMVTICFATWSLMPIIVALFLNQSEPNPKDAPDSIWDGQFRPLTHVTPYLINVLRGTSQQEIVIPRKTIRSWTYKLVLLSYSFWIFFILGVWLVRRSADPATDDLIFSNRASDVNAIRVPVYYAPVTAVGIMVLDAVVLLFHGSGVDISPSKSVIALSLFRYVIATCPKYYMLTHSLVYMLTAMVIGLSFFRAAFSLGSKSTELRRQFAELTTNDGTGAHPMVGSVRTPPVPPVDDHPAGDAQPPQHAASSPVTRTAGAGASGATVTGSKRGPPVGSRDDSGRTRTDFRHRIRESSVRIKKSLNQVKSGSVTGLTSTQNFSVMYFILPTVLLAIWFIADILVAKYIVQDETLTLDESTGDITRTGSLPRVQLSPDGKPHSQVSVALAALFASFFLPLAYGAYRLSASYDYAFNANVALFSFLAMVSGIGSGMYMQSVTESNIVFGLALFFPPLMITFPTLFYGAWIRNGYRLRRRIVPEAEGDAHGESSGPIAPTPNTADARRNSDVVSDDQGVQRAAADAAAMFDGSRRVSVAEDEVNAREIYGELDHSIALEDVSGETLTPNAKVHHAWDWRAISALALSFLLLAGMSSTIYIRELGQGGNLDDVESDDNDAAPEQAQNQLAFLSLIAFGIVPFVLSSTILPAVKYFHVYQYGSAFILSSLALAEAGVVLACIMLYLRLGVLRESGLLVPQFPDWLVFSPILLYPLFSATIFLVYRWARKGTHRTRDAAALLAMLAITAVPVGVLVYFLLRDPNLQVMGFLVMFAYVVFLATSASLMQLYMRNFQIRRRWRYAFFFALVGVFAVGWIISLDNKNEAGPFVGFSIAFVTLFMWNSYSMLRFLRRRDATYLFGPNVFPTFRLDFQPTKGVAEVRSSNRIVMHLYGGAGIIMWYGVIAALFERAVEFGVVVAAFGALVGWATTVYLMFRRYTSINSARGWITRELVAVAFQQAFAQAFRLADIKDLHAEDVVPVLDRLAKTQEEHTNMGGVLRRSGRGTVKRTNSDGSSKAGTLGRSTSGGSMRSLPRSGSGGSMRSTGSFDGSTGAGAGGGITPGGMLNHQDSGGSVRSSGSAMISAAGMDAAEVQAQREHSLSSMMARQLDDVLADRARRLQELRDGVWNDNLRMAYLDLADIDQRVSERFIVQMQISVHFQMMALKLAEEDKENRSKLLDRAFAAFCLRHGLNVSPFQIRGWDKEGRAEFVKFFRVFRSEQIARSIEIQEVMQAQEEAYRAAAMVREQEDRQDPVKYLKDKCVKLQDAVTSHAEDAGRVADEQDRAMHLAEAEKLRACFVRAEQQLQLENAVAACTSDLRRCSGAEAQEASFTALRSQLDAFFAERGDDGYLGDASFDEDRALSGFHQKSNWRPRVAEFIKLGRPRTDAKLIVSGAEAGDVNQGQLDTCWFLGALAVLVGHDDSFVDQIFRYRNEKHGVYVIQFYRQRQPTLVLVDTRLPEWIDGPSSEPQTGFRSRQRGIAFARLRPVDAPADQEDELWVALMEKAYAKLYGGYGAIERGKINIALVDLTGGAADEIELINGLPRLKGKKIIGQEILRRDYAINAANLFNTLTAWQHSGFLMGCSRTPKKAYTAKHASIQESHAYAILEFFENFDRRWVVLYNPWGSKAPLVQKHPVEFRGDSSKGLVLLSFEDFVSNFTNVYICRLFDDWNTLEAKAEYSRWDQNLWGGATNLINNPQFRLEVRGGEAVDVYVRLMQPWQTTGKLGERYYPIGFYLIENNGARALGFFDDFQTDRKRSVKSMMGGSTIYHISDFEYSGEVGLAIEGLAPGAYTIVPCTYKPKKAGEFKLVVYTRPVSAVNNASPVMVTGGGGLLGGRDDTGAAMQLQFRPQRFRWRRRVKREARASLEWLAPTLYHVGPKLCQVSPDNFPNNQGFMTSNNRVYFERQMYVELRPRSADQLQTGQATTVYIDVHERKDETGGGLRPRRSSNGGASAAQAQLLFPMMDSHYSVEVQVYKMRTGLVKPEEAKPIDVRSIKHINIVEYEETARVFAHWQGHVGDCYIVRVRHYKPGELELDLHSQMSDPIVACLPLAQVQRKSFLDTLRRSIDRRSGGGRSNGNATPSDGSPARSRGSRSRRDSVRSNSALPPLAPVSSAPTPPTVVVQDTNVISGGGGGSGSKRTPPPVIHIDSSDNPAPGAGGSGDGGAAPPGPVSSNASGTADAAGDDGSGIGSS